MDQWCSFLFCSPGLYSMKSLFKEKKVHIYIKIISILLFKVKESYFDFHLYTRCVLNIIMINIRDLYMFS